MPEAAVQPEASAAPLNQVERVVDTFVAPSKTFTDLRRSASWWLPWLIGVIVTLGLGYSIQSRITWEKAYDNILKQNPKQAQRLEQLPPEQQARQKQIAAKFTGIIFWASPALGLLFSVIIAAILLATINFGFGGTSKFSQMFALVIYGFLPLALKAILGIVTIFAGVDPDSFNLNNYVGTNIGYYLPQDISKPLMALATSIDMFTIWILILLTIGCAIIGNVKKGKAATAVFGWWILIVAAKMIGAMFS
ncbi:MAG: YIP1 family protein [Acidobacteriaceae bacterium]